MRGVVVHIWLILFLRLCPLSVTLINRSIPAEYQLVRDLLDGYLPSVMPKSYSDESIEVQVSYELASLTSMNEKTQTMSIVGWFYLIWDDDLIVWDPAMYDNIDSVVLPSDKIWLPDVVFNNGIDKLFYDLSPFFAIVDNNGSVLFQPGGPMSLSCNFNLVYYPFDEQVCSLEVISWSTTESKMRLSVGQLIISTQVENGEWRVVGASEEKKSIPYPGGNYSAVTFTLSLKRKPQYQVVNIVLPVITLPFLNLVVFCLPPECGEKVSLSITILLAFSVWLLMMSSITPTSSDNMSIIAICTVIFMALSTLSVIATVAVVHLYHKDETCKIPLWIRRALQCYRRQSSRPKQGESSDESDRRFSEKMTWRHVAAAVDSIGFYIFFVIISTIIAVAGGKIIAYVVN